MTRTPDLLADWFLGGAGKRRLLAFVADASAGARFSQKELADAAELHDKGSVIRHLRVLEHAGLIRRELPDRDYVVCSWPQRQALADWLGELQSAEQRTAIWRQPLPRSR